MFCIRGFEVVQKTWPPRNIPNKKCCHIDISVIFSFILEVLYQRSVGHNVHTPHEQESHFWQITLHQSLRIHWYSSRIHDQWTSPPRAINLALILIMRRDPSLFPSMILLVGGLGPFLVNFIFLMESRTPN